jgi:hypothetical protein
LQYARTVPIVIVENLSNGLSGPAVFGQYLLHIVTKALVHAEENSVGQLLVGPKKSSFNLFFYRTGSRLVADLMIPL